MHNRLVLVKLPHHAHHAAELFKLHRMNVLLPNAVVYILDCYVIEKTEEEKLPGWDK